MIKEVITKTNQNECQEMKSISGRKMALLELSKYLQNMDNELLYEKLVNELIQVEEKTSDWWARMGLKYNFKPSPEITFNSETSDILLNKSDIETDDFNIY